jgi:GTPase-activator protein for Ras-like GTPase
LAQSIIRMHQKRKNYKAKLQHYKDNEGKLVKIQALFKGSRDNLAYKTRKAFFKSNEALYEKIQAVYKGKKQRQKYLERLGFFDSHLDKIIRIQAWYRGRHAYNQFRTLSTSMLTLEMRSGGADAKTLQQYIKLLDDNVDDFDEERNLDALRQRVVKMIRETLGIETQVNELDAKIALLVKNRISLEEVIGFSSKQMRSHLAQELQSKLEKDLGVITLKGHDKDTNEKRKKYEELFYLLQTQPKYLANLMFSMNKSGGASVTKFLEGVVLTLFGQVQSPREEYLFLNLIDMCINTELNDIEKLEDFWRDNPLFIKLVLQYIRGAKERKFLRALLQPLIKSVMDDNSLELETEPVALYKAIIRMDELSTGEKSTRNYDATPAEAAAEPDVILIQMGRVKKLKEISKTFLNAITGSLKTMPFGIRYIAMTMKECMQRKFPGADSELEINRIVGNLIYYRYINPAIVAPEAFDVIDTSVSPAQRKNLAEVAKTLHQIQVSRTAAGSNEASASLNDFILTSTKSFSHFIKEASTVETIQEQFGMNEFLDMSLQEKPSIYVTPEEVIQVHTDLVANLAQLSADPQDPLNVILTELGTVPPVASAAKGPGSELTLHLTNRFAKADDPEETARRALIAEAKLLIKCIVRINVGKSLLKILEEPVTEQVQASYAEYLQVATTKIQSRMNKSKSFTVTPAIEAASSLTNLSPLQHLKNDDES